MPAALQLLAHARARTILLPVVVLAAVVLTAVVAPRTAQAAGQPVPPYEVVPGVVLHPRPRPAVVLPMHRFRITGRFGERSGLWTSRHTGLDFAAPYGTRIRSVAAGVITRTGFAGRYGRRTVLRLASGTRVWFCHQSRVRVAVGDRVQAGQVIGRVGTTGNVTGPHLHLEVHPLGRRHAIDPRSWLRHHRRR